MIRALIFDFDGLILDTETIDLQSWQDVYSRYGVTFPTSEWEKSLGGSIDIFDPYTYLVAQYQGDLIVDDVRKEKRQRANILVRSQLPLPGVLEYLADGSKMGLKLGVASSSSRDWVVGNLDRLGIIARFDCIKCAEDVSKTKPSPELFEAVLEQLGVEADQAIVFEDSPNGVAAGLDAGIFTVVVPNGVTSRLSFQEPDLRLTSLADMSLSKLIQLAEAQVGGSGNAVGS
jgi:HAD superfamily hydrolase (TIGR01509 family)